MAENEAKKPDTQKEAKSADNKDGASAAVPGKGRAGQVLISVALALGMVVGSASAALVVASLVMKNRAPAAEAASEGKAAGKPEAASAKEEKPSELAIENPLIVNVYQTQQRRYLSVKPVLVFAGEKPLKEVKEGKMVELQHIMIGILKRKTLDQLDDPDATNTIGRELQETLNLKLNLNNAITSVYFTQFVVQ